MDAVALPRRPRRPTVQNSFNFNQCLLCELLLAAVAVCFLAAETCLAWLGFASSLSWSAILLFVLPFLIVQKLSFLHTALRLPLSAAVVAARLFAPTCTAHTTTALSTPPPIYAARRVCYVFFHLLPFVFPSLVWSYLILSCLFITPYCVISSYLVLYCLVFTCPVLHCLVSLLCHIALSHLILSYIVLSCLVLYCLILFACLILSYLACLVLPRLVVSQAVGGDVLEGLKEMSGKGITPDETTLLGELRAPLSGPMTARQKKTK